MKVAGRWMYLYHAIDQHGQVIDVLVATRRDEGATRSFFARALRLGPSPVEVTTDRAPPTRVLSTSSSQRPSMSPSRTPTTASRLIMAG